MLDFHNHVIPGVDDGSASLDESLAALKMMWAQGITHIIATPHFRASVAKDPTELEQQMVPIDAAWEVLVEAVRETLPRLRLDRGVELALDDPSPDATDARLRLARTRFLLVEFPNFRIPPASVRPLAYLRARGITPIVAHPERYADIDAHFDTFRGWKAAGAFLQLNAGSVIGAYGAAIERNAWRCLKAGVVDYMSSDYHARGNCPVAEAREKLSLGGGVKQMRMLSNGNGDRLIDGLDPMPVGPFVRPESRWRRLKTAFRRK